MCYTAAAGTMVIAYVFSLRQLTLLRVDLFGFGIVLQFSYLVISGPGHNLLVD